ncbi:hypothetical protein ACVDG5_035140 [Mesorhizobium sp. ORM6]
MKMVTGIGQSLPRVGDVLTICTSVMRLRKSLVDPEHRNSRRQLGEKPILLLAIVVEHKVSLTQILPIPTGNHPKELSGHSLSDRSEPCAD